MRFVVLPAVTVATLVAIPLWSQQAAAKADTWPDFRGTTWDGHAASASLPLRWSEEKNVRWKTPIVGRGWSSPVVFDGRVWITSATERGRRLLVVACDLESGKKIVERTLFIVEEPENCNSLNSYASPSPVIEAGRVYVHFGTYGTACLDTNNGETIWERRDIHCDHMEGPGSSPVLWRDLLIVHMDGGDVQYVIALDKKTGKTRWKRPRSTRFRENHIADQRKAYSTPIVIDVAGNPTLISSGAVETAAYDPATGKEVWKVRTGGFSMSSRPVAGNGLVFLNSGFMRPQLFAVRPGGSGDVTDDAIVWSYKRNVPTMPSPLFVDGHVYMVNDSGIASCLDAKTGERVWHKRIDGRHCASPIYAAGRLYFFDRDGGTTVLAAGKEPKELAVNRLDDGFMASAAVVGDAFILRTRTHLYRVERE